MLDARLAADKAARLEMIAGAEAFFEQHPVEPDFQFRERRHDVVERDRLRAFLLYIELQMILKILPDARQVRDNRNIKTTQIIRRADAGDHQKMRGVDGPGRRDHLSRGKGSLFLSIEDIFNTGRASALKSKAPCLRACQNGQVAASARRIEIGKRRAPSEAPVDGHVHPGDTFLLKAVHVIGKGITCLLPRLHPGVIERIIARADGDMERAIAAAIVIGPAIIRFRLFEIRQAIGVGPVLQPRQRRPAVIVERMAAHIAHPVDRRGTAKRLAPRPVYLAAVQMFLRFGVILPGEAGRMHRIA